MTRPWALLGVLLQVACGPGAPPAPPNVLLITVDTLRADHIGAWGAKDVETPNMDALARSGVRFSRATTVTNNTLPSHVAMLTGRHPSGAGVPRNGHKLAPDVPYLPELLGARGYETAAFVSASALSGTLGLSRGFSTFDETFDVRELDQRQRHADATTAAAVAWLGTPREALWFAWVHYFDPHYPYTPPAEYLPRDGYTGPADGSLEYLLTVWGRGVPQVPTAAEDRAHMVRRYDGEIAYLDGRLGALLAAVDRARTLVVFTADHGESLTEHGYLFDHGEFLYQPSMHVPLVVAGPGIEAAERSDLAQTIDIFSTILGAVGAPSPADVDGVDLRTGSPPRTVAFAESCRPWHVEKEVARGEWPNLAKAQSALRWPHKLIVTPYMAQVELYDLEADPGETANIAATSPEVVSALTAELEAWRGGSFRVALPDHENMERIKALGYVDDDPGESAP